MTAFVKRLRDRAHGSDPAEPRLLQGIRDTVSELIFGEHCWPKGCLLHGCCTHAFGCRSVTPHTSALTRTPLPGYISSLVRICNSIVRAETFHDAQVAGTECHYLWDFGDWAQTDTNRLATSPPSGHRRLRGRSELGGQHST
jgi:hypothetical protein